MTFGLSPNMLAIVLMVISVGMLAALDSIVKFAAVEGMHPIEIVFFRNLFGLVALAPLFMRHGLGQLRTKRLGFHLARSGIHGLSMMAWFWAITLIPLADATALSFVIPIYASVGAILFLGEPSQFIRWFAIALGFAGMLIILRPGFAEVGLGSWLVVFSAIAVAISKLMVKSLSRTDSPATIVFFMSFTVTGMTFIPALFFWTWPSAEVWIALVMLGFAGTAAHVTQTNAYKIGDVTAVEPMAYFRLIWAALFGFVLFGEVPEIWTWIGTAVIVTGAILLARSEARVGRALKTAQGEAQ